jgi:hypothetical protein
MDVVRQNFERHWGITAGVDQNILVPHIAAERGDLNMLKEAIKLGMDPTQKVSIIFGLVMSWLCFLFC